MSMGFLTESALLPSKAKPIKVDSSSIFDLKAVVHKHKRELEETKAIAGTPGVRRVVGKKFRPSGSRADELFNKKNKGVDDRNQAEEEEFRQTEDKLRASQEALARKAALYEKLSKGQPPPPDAKGSFLVDFKKKVETTGGTSYPSNASPSPSPSPKPQALSDAGDTVEIEDDFGRVIVVAKGSPAHLEYLRRHKEPNGPSLATDESTRTGTGPNIQGAGVTSQWEHGFSQQEKEYLQQMTKRTNAVRTQHKDDKRERRIAERRAKLKAKKGGRTAAPSSLSREKEVKPNETIGSTQNSITDSPTKKMASDFLSRLAQGL